MALQVEVQYNNPMDRDERRRLVTGRRRTEINDTEIISPYRLLIHALDRLDWSVTTVLSPIGITGIGLFSVYYAALSYGIIVITVVGGRKLLTKVVAQSNTSPMVIFIGVPLLPFSLIALEAIDIEDRILALWRNKIFPLFMAKAPLVSGILNYYWPEMARQPVITKPNSITSTIDYVTRCIISGLSLPFVAYFVGKLLFPSKDQTPLQKTVIVSNTLV